MKNNDTAPVSWLIKLLNKEFKQLLMNLNEKNGITESQVGVIRYLYFHQEEEVNPIDLEKRMSVSKPTISGILKRMEEKSLIRFEKSCKDGRYKQIKLEKKGLELNEQLEKNLICAENMMFQGLNETEIKEFKKSIIKCLNNLREENVHDQKVA